MRKAEPGTIKKKQAQMLRGKPARTGEREQQCEEQGVLGRQFNSHESNCSAGNVIPSSSGFRRLLTKSGHCAHPPILLVPPWVSRESSRITVAECFRPENEKSWT